MEPVSLVLAALAAGVGAGVSDAAKSGVIEAYQLLRGRLSGLFRGDDEAEAALTSYEAAPNERSIRALGDHLQRHQVSEQPALLQAAETLLTLAGPAAAGPGSFAAGVVNIWATSGGVASGTMHDVTQTQQFGNATSPPGEDAANPPPPG